MRAYSFEKLIVWQESRKLTKEVYLLSKKFPKEEQFGLTSQVRRAIVSVCSNIAEGSSRSTSKDKARFTEMSFGSLLEVLNQLILAADLEFIKIEELNKLRPRIDEIAMMLNGLKKSQLNS